MCFFFHTKKQNLYETIKRTYNKLLTTESISKTYKKTTDKIYSNINKEAKTMTNNCKIATYLLITL